MNDDISEDRARLMRDLGLIAPEPRAKPSRTPCAIEWCPHWTYRGAKWCEMHKLKRDSKLGSIEACLNAMEGALLLEYRASRRMSAKDRRRALQGIQSILTVARLSLEELHHDDCDYVGPSTHRVGGDPEARSEGGVSSGMS